LTDCGSAVRVAIVEDDAYLRDSLCRLIADAEGFECSTVFRTVEEALIGLPKQPVDVLLLDIGLPGRLGSEAVSELRSAMPKLAILMWTVYADRPKVFASICNGANGYLLKSTPPQQILDSIRAAHEGGSPLSPEIASGIITVFQKLGPSGPSDSVMTSQEQQLLWLLAQGYSYDSAGRQMNISVNTVRNYIRSIYQKLHVHSRSEAVSKALRQGLIG
jgi:DNA-binding NarL/FixJ family response regulator